MCYQLTTFCVCDDCGDDVKTFTTDKLCPTDVRCAERNKRPRRQEERVSSRLCDNCQKYTNRVYHSGLTPPEPGRSKSRETDRILTIRTDESSASTVRADRRRRDSSGDDSDATLRGGRTDKRTPSRRKFDSMVDKLWDAKDSTDSKDRSRGGHHGKDRRDTFSSVTEKSTDREDRSRGGKHGRNRSDSVGFLTDDYSIAGTSREGCFRSAVPKSFRPLESDRNISSSTYRDDSRFDSTYRGSESPSRRFKLSRVGFNLS
ncbi:hypothetical protein H2200_004464 [Cladophialophora chaetospira]|uniref:Uncharacterized protein n=1 Tax=Cladophialophora chaetospira TaxID=386627 RepID=A0AA39CKI7_9EURO|nr:hypothetical protein H2200_004464 [Cladophialophora chaetospira]